MVGRPGIPPRRTVAGRRPPGEGPHPGPLIRAAFEAPAKLFCALSHLGVCIFVGGTGAQKVESLAAGSGCGPWAGLGSQSTAALLHLGSAKQPECSSSEEAWRMKETARWGLPGGCSLVHWAHITAHLAGPCAPVCLWGSIQLWGTQPELLGLLPGLDLPPTCPWPAWPPSSPVA